jgi:maleylpyruvate isomerase
MMKTQLYSFWRSSASFRARIALNLKGMDYEVIPVHLGKQGGQHLQPDYLEMNPTSLVPLLVHDSHKVHQSLAIIEYLDEIKGDPPLLPKSPEDRAWVRSLAMDIAMDIHPISNLRVLRYLLRDLKISTEAKDVWYQHWMRVGLDNLEKQLRQDQRVGRFAYGDHVGLIDICLVPQIFNALSAKMDMGSTPTLMRIFHECMQLPAFIKASWENQIDAEGSNPSIPPEE